jgi:hypothetical protein
MGGRAPPAQRSEGLGIQQFARSGRGWGTQVSTMMQEVQRPLLAPDECLRMPGPKNRTPWALLLKQVTWSFIAGRFQRSTVASPFIFRAQRSPSARRSLSQNVAIHCLVSLSPRSRFSTPPVAVSASAAVSRALSAKRIDSSRLRFRNGFGLAAVHKPSAAI